MGNKANLGGGIIGLVFLALGAFKFISGDGWIVWILLGFLFGGFGALRQLLGSDKP
ncbi:hypothetical protein ACRAQ7_12380 [Erythrobacter sp. W53]|uniref:hypothetical protein n=1 Tax=Erythrobacter sp. W53 TaxID=3425947 RepID=UPI003D76A0B9